ncbi:DUF1801 domain-containing protein [bacterium]|nr:DUF1801 domain-containing protein [bacterium]
MRKVASDFEDYFKDFSPEVRQRLQTLRQTIQALAPEATEAISYAIPTFKLNGKNLVHFAAFKKHIGFFPGARAMQVFAPQLSEYKISKGTLQLPLERPLPLELIKTMVEFCLSQLNPSFAASPELPQGSASLH